MPARFHADLHCHSTFSDGTLTPAQLAQRARTAGVTLWALTDHDELAGIPAAQQAAAAQGLDFLTGVEISVSFAQACVHIVGLGVDPAHPALQQGLADLRNSRGPRAQEMGRQLEAVGIPNAYEGALRYVGNPALISRTHFARHLVETGVCKDIPEVFKHYLADGKPGHVPQRWASLQEAVGWITQAQGVAVMAHPARYGFTANEEHALFSSFCACGGQAVEVVTGSHAPHEYATYAALARELGLAASRGSDFHSPQESKIDLGGLPPDLPGLQPVWDLLQDRIVRAPAP
ncbi:phosphoesterase [Comamonas aquatica DA1877]|uniref:Phosphoesterase n=1 Tax=Comamonas aquatica DA1877 TaxID=1457173 RepID=A0A014NNQ8_9BURK|nr:PHP domain-containing protein [Comamonas aquatica]EXU81088.1 phosphoesterase [Comamonas aquatica DA1877]